MKKTTEKLLKVAEYGVAGIIWSYDYAQFVKRHEEAAKRMTTLDKNATKKEKVVAGTKLFGVCYIWRGYHSVLPPQCLAKHC